MNGKSNMGSDISKSMTGCRMRVTITEVTAKTCQTDEQPTRIFYRIYTGTNSKDDINKNSLRTDYFPLTVRQCISHWIDTMILILGKSLLAIKLYLIMTSLLTTPTSFS